MVHHQPPTREASVNIAIASDHAGFTYKSLLVQYLREQGHTVVDHGTNSTATVDYPDYIRQAAAAVASGKSERGIVLGGSGNGEAIAANRYRGVRCALCWSTESARLSRVHNDANMLSIGERLIPEPLMFEIVRIWLETPFEGGRHIARIQKLDEPA
jgi:ribose 5-phosphate isomerase B